MLSREMPASTHGSTLALEGTLDSAAVSEVLPGLARASPRAPVTLDFSRVREVDWFALATLALSLARMPAASVFVKGYSEQHARLLAYLGVSRECCTTPTEPPEGDSAERDERRDVGSSDQSASDPRS